MKKILMISLVLGFNFISASALCQDKNAAEYLRQLNIYKKAKFYNDPITTRTAIYNLIELDPGSFSWMDSLAYEYYAYRQYTSSLLVTLEALKRNANNLAMLELKALSWENIGDQNKALETYESLFLKSNSTIILYKIGFLQLNLNRLNEAKTTADILLGKEDINEITMNFSKKDESIQQVTLKAAIYNMLGLIAKVEGDKEAARKSFNEALKLFPEFEVVLDNLKELDG